jgi:hypothetical protein
MTNWPQPFLWSSMPATLSPKISTPVWSRRDARHRRSRRAALLFFLMASTALLRAEYFVGFDQPGRPPDHEGLTWDYQAELSPAPDWETLIPGDGFAYLSVERSALGRKRGRHGAWPFQTLSFGPIGSNHRISMRAKNAAIPGVAAMIFTYREKDRVDEIDIEIVADDTEAPDTGHPTGPDGGWTDIRLNTWAEADKVSLRPGRHIQMPILDAEGRKVSHRDHQFHIYTIEWRPAEIRFYIDGVLQKTINDLVPDAPSRVIFGLREMPWAGEPDWEGTQTLLVDWITVEPLD